MEYNDYLPVSSISEFVYCPRNFYYRTVEKIDRINFYMMEGTLSHETLDKRKKLKRKDKNDPAYMGEDTDRCAWCSCDFKEGICEYYIGNFACPDCVIKYELNLIKNNYEKRRKFNN